MPDKTKYATKINKLKSLVDSPQEQVVYALELLQTERQVLVVDAALQVLAENSTPQSRPVLLTLYDYFNSDGSKRDLGGSMRAAILKVLRDWQQQTDLPLLEGAVRTYEFAPPGREEVAAGLRAAALVSLNELDRVLAGYHAVRILVDVHTSRMSGEPAATAARVLAAQASFLPLYQYAMQSQEQIPEVLGECLRYLIKIPDSLLPSLVEEFRQTKDEVVLIGLFDLVLGHPSYANFSPFLSSFLTTTRNYDLYRYLVTAIITSGKKDLQTLLQTLAKDENDRRKVETLIEFLPMLKKSEALTDSLTKKLKTLK